MSIVERVDKTEAEPVLMLNLIDTSGNEPEGIDIGQEMVKKGQALRLEFN